MIAKMITRKDGLTIALLLLWTLVTVARCRDVKSHDTNDWIPIPQPSHGVQKKATGRVLTLPFSSSPQRFFPEEFRSTRQAEYQQYLRETSGAVKPATAHYQQKQPFTPQQLEQYYIDQMKRLSEQRNLQAAQDSHQYEIPPTKPYNNVKMQSKLLKQTYDGLPTEFLPPPQEQQSRHPLAHHYIFPSDPDSVPIAPEAIPVQYSGQPVPTTLTQFVQQPPERSNGTVEFYNNIKENFHSSSIRQSRPVEYSADKTTPPDVKEDIQLLYLPIEQLVPTQKNFEGSQGGSNPYQIALQPTAPARSPVQVPVQAVNQLGNHQIDQHQSNYHQKDFQRDAVHQDALLRSIENDFVQQALQAHKLQQQLEREVPTPETIVKKRKPHQPPLAIYMNGQTNARATDVVRALKQSKSVDVQDTIGPNSPHVFVGPANLRPPNGFTKFELPYLSTIESNRVERRVDHLPFFVAPLNYKTPPGYEKIPFPPPHVGSVVINANTLVSDEGTTRSNLEAIVSNAGIGYNEQSRAEEIFSNPTKRPIRQRGRHPQRITTPAPQIETTTYNSLNPIFDRQHQNVLLTSTVNPGNQKAIAPQTQFNQNKYLPGISLEQLREYQVDKQPPIQSSSQGSTKQLYNYLEISTEPPGLYNSHDVSPEKRKPKPVFELPSTIGPTLLPYELKYRNNAVNQPNVYNQIVPVTVPTNAVQPQKFEEVIRLVKVAEEMIIRPQSNDPSPKDIFPVAPQIDNVKEVPIVTKNSKQYLPIHSHQGIPQPSGYDRLFDAPFATDADVNQINSAARGSADKNGGRVQLKYVVLDDYPATVNTSSPATATIGTHSPKKFQDAIVEPKLKQQIIVIGPPGTGINDLVDPTVRQLLTPALLAPTEKPLKIKADGAEPSTVVTKKQHEAATTTVEPIEYKEVTTTTTVKPEVARVRNRGRGGARYNDRTTTYSPRRNPTRTRARSRLTTTTAALDQDRELYTTTSTPRTVSTRQRFRSRGRPMISQGYSTTVSNVQHTTEMSTVAAEILPNEANKDDRGYEVGVYTEEAASRPQLITRAKILSPEEEYLATKYNLPLGEEPERYDVEIVTDAADIGDVTAKRADETTTVYSPAIEYVVRSIHKSTEKPRVRQRIRGKSRLTNAKTTTRPTSTSTEVPPNLDDASSSVEEFYGFFRPPNFKGAAAAEEPARTSKVFAVSTEKDLDGDDDEGTDERIQVIGNSNSKEGTVKPVQFVGEILPKYSTTEKYFEIAPELTPVTDLYVMTTSPSPPTSHSTKRRSRGRYPTKKPIEHAERTEESDEEEAPNVVEARTTPRTRTRGRVHFKLPVIVTTDGGEDANDNYPALYLKAQHDQESYTPQTSSPQTEKFKITVEPGGYDEDEAIDQEPHASVISGKFVPANHLQSTSNPKELKYLGGKHVHFNGSNFRANLTTVKMVEVELITDAPEGASEKPKRRGYWKLLRKKNPEDFDVVVSRENDYETVEDKHRTTGAGGGLDDTEEMTSTVSAIREEDLLSTTSLADRYEGGPKKSHRGKTTSAVVDDDDDAAMNGATSMYPRILMDGLRTSTSTSTEISRNAEVCSKGVCVKSDDYDADK